jgi:hypothetical protein
MKVQKLVLPVELRSSFSPYNSVIQPVQTEDGLEPLQCLKSKDKLRAESHSLVSWNV